MPGLARLSPPIPEVEGELWLLTHPDLQNTVRVRAFMDYCAAEIAKRRKVIEGSGLMGQLARAAAGGLSDSGPRERELRLATPACCGA